MAIFRPEPWLLLSATVGMYHGGFDMVIFQYLFPRPLARLLWMAVYAAFAALLVGLYFANAPVFLMLLLMVGIFHFGSEDSLSEHEGDGPLLFWTERLARGLLPVSLASLFWPEQAGGAFTLISDAPQFSAGLTQAAGMLAALSVPSGLVACALALRARTQTAIDIAAVAAAFALLPPATGAKSPS